MREKVGKRSCRDGKASLKECFINLSNESKVPGKFIWANSVVVSREVTIIVIVRCLLLDTAKAYALWCQK